MRCKMHKRYKGVLRPRCSCVDCWGIFLDRADYQTICQEIDRRSPEPCGTYVEQNPCSDEGMVLSILENKKKEQS